MGLTHPIFKVILFQLIPYYYNALAEHYRILIGTGNPYFLHILEAD